MPVDENLVRELLHARAGMAPQGMGGMAGGGAGVPPGMGGGGMPPMGGGSRGLPQMAGAGGGIPPGAGPAGGAGPSAVEALIAKLTGGGGPDPMAPQGMGIGHPPPGLPAMAPSEVVQQQIPPMPIPGVAIGSMPEAGIDQSAPFPNPHGLKTRRGGPSLTPRGEGGIPSPKQNLSKQPKAKRNPPSDNRPGEGGVPPTRKAQGSLKGQPKPKKRPPSDSSKEELAEQIDSSSGMKKAKK